MIKVYDFVEVVTFPRTLFEMNFEGFERKLVNPVRCYLPTRLDGHKCARIHSSLIQKIILLLSISSWGAYGMYIVQLSVMKTILELLLQYFIFSHFKKKWNLHYEFKSEMNFYAEQANVNATFHFASLVCLFVCSLKFLSRF